VNEALTTHEEAILVVEETVETQNENINKVIVFVLFIC
jgi:hypothetical protein